MTWGAMVEAGALHFCGEWESILGSASAEIGVYGGSGFYSLLENPEEMWVDTPYGMPSDKIALGEIAGRKVAFLPRHGKDHRYPPQSINYRANAWAFKELGITRIIGPTACGSLQAYVKPGSMVVADQIIDRTTGRKDTFYDGPVTTHVSFADPYCEQMRPIAVDALRGLEIDTHARGTIVVIQGPRFSTRAESKWFSGLGWEVINMTNYPESYLARELEMCYVNISLITDYDVGLEGQGGIKPVSHAEVMEVFARNNERVKQGIFKIVEALPADRTCSCGSALAGAR
jgi:5'-methylthioadenosine phosphorylase